MSTPSSIQSHFPVSPQLQPPPDAKVRAGLLTELFARTREGSPLGVLPIALIAVAHAGAIDLMRILIWVCLTFIAGFLHWRLAVAFLRKPVVESTELPRWTRLEASATIAVSLAWASAVWLLDTGGMDGLLYFKMVVLVAVATFTLGTQGMLPRIYGCFLIGIVAALVAFFATRVSHDVHLATMLQIGMLVFGGVMMMRSRVENRRARQWIEARLGQEELVERLREFASRDVLTGAFSRAHIQQALRAGSSRLRRSGQPFGVAMLDIDNFKQINDCWGHAIGDEVLRRVTKAIHAELRDTDLFGRWGGEEFIVVFPEARLRAASETAERLRACLRNIDFAPAAPSLRVTVSIGVAQAEEGEKPDALIGRADAALYSAKGAGRDRVAIAPCIAAADASEVGCERK